MKWSVNPVFHAHQIALPALKALGFEWELRSRGEQKLGLLRRRLNKATHLECPRRLVFMGGLGDTPLSWVRIFLGCGDLIRSKYDEIVLFDFPGFAGFLAREPAYDSLEQMKAAVFDALDTLKPQTLMGHSLGGWLAASYDVYRRQRSTGNRHAYHGPEKLILVCPAGVLLGEENEAYWKDVFHGAIEKGFASFEGHIFHRPPIWFRFLKKSFAGFFKKPEIVKFLGSIEREHFLHDRDLKDLKADTTFIWGAQDSMIPSSWVHDWTALMSRPARIELMEGVGHSPQIESPLRTIGLIRQIL